MSLKIDLTKSWLNHLEDEFSKTYMIEIKEFLRNRISQRKTIYPPGKEIFNCFNLTSYENTKVVILGQDPYHGAGQAHGLSFSVKDNISIPPSLKNIFKELNSDLKINIPCSGNLTSWALEGVLLLNSSLTVESNNPNSHQNIGWKFFTDKVIEVLGNKKDMVYILWGKNAQLKKSLINTQENLVIESAHPSPFSADKGFFGSKPFSKTNDYLIDKGKRPINWKLV